MNNKWESFNKRFDFTVELGIYSPTWGELYRLVSENVENELISHLSELIWGDVATGFNDFEQIQGIKYEVAEL